MIHIPVSWDLWLLLKHCDPGIPTCTLGPWYTSNSTLEPQDPYLHTGTLWYSYPHNETSWLLPANWDPMMLLPTHGDCMTPTCTLEPCDTPTCTIRHPDPYLHMIGTLWCTPRSLDSHPHTETPKYSYLNIGTPGPLPAHWDLVIPLPPNWDPMIPFTCTMTPSDSYLCTTSSEAVILIPITLRHNETPTCTLRPRESHLHTKAL